MNKSDFQKKLAEMAYNIGFGAKKHFATYDIIVKAPGWIGFISTAFGILGLVYDPVSVKIVSAIFIIVGIMGLYINFYDHKKDDYEHSGVELTKLFNRLKDIYFEVKSASDDFDSSSYREDISEIEKNYYLVSISKQILFSNWYAHYKFFWEQQIGWVNDEIKFRFFRDKVPLSLWFFIFTMLITSVMYKVIIC